MRHVQKPIKKYSFLMILEVRTLKNAIEKLSKSELRTTSKASLDVWSILEAFWLPKSIKIAPQIDTKASSRSMFMLASIFL